MTDCLDVCKFSTFAESPDQAWRDELPRLLESAEAESYDDDPGRRLRHATGRAADAWRGRVPAREVAAAVQAALEVQP